MCICIYIHKLYVYLCMYLCGFVFVHIHTHRQMCINVYATQTRSQIHACAYICIYMYRHTHISFISLTPHITHTVGSLCKLYFLQCIYTRFMFIHTHVYLPPLNGKFFEFTNNVGKLSGVLLRAFQIQFKESRKHLYVCMYIYVCIYIYMSVYGMYVCICVHVCICISCIMYTYMYSQAGFMQIVLRTCQTSMRDL